MMTVSMSLFIIVLLFAIVPSGLIWYFVAHDRGPKEPVDALWLAAGFGVLAAILAAFAELQLIPAHVLKPTIFTATSTIFFGSMGIGFIEEVCKFLPLALSLYKKPFFNEYTDGIIYFAIAGFAFGAPENILYAFQYGVKAGFLRVFLTPFFHAAMTAFVGYYLISVKRQKKSILAPVVALLVTAVLHGFYDFGLLAATRSSVAALIALIITFGMSTYLFVLYKKATNQDRLGGFSNMPAVGSQPPAAPSRGIKASLGLVIGILAIPASIMPIIGLALGLIAMIFGTTTRKPDRRLISSLTILFSALAIMASLGFLAFAFQATPIN